MLKALMTVSGFTLLSRFLGVARDMLMANYLGAGADAWLAAFRLPNLFRRTLGEGAFNAAFIPMYSGRLAESGAEVADRFASKIIALMALLLSGLFVLAFIFIRPLTRVLNLGYPPETLELAVDLSRITVVYLVFICLVAAFSGILNSRKIFGMPTFAYAFLNIALIGGMLIFVPLTRNPNQVLAWSLVAAGVLQLGMVIFATFRAKFCFVPQALRIDTEVKTLACLMGPGLISAGIQQLNLFVGTNVASFQASGQTYLYFADRINQLPLGLIGIAFGTVLLPDLAAKIKSGRAEEAKQSLTKGMELATFAAVPAMVGMFVIAEPIIFALFKGGDFTSTAAAMSAQALTAFALGTPAYILAKVLQPSYFSRGDTKTPMRFTLISAVINVILCGIAFFVIGRHGPLHVGCAVATTIAGWINFLLLFQGVIRRGDFYLTSGFVSRTSRMLLASILMGAVVFFVAKLLYSPLHSDFRLTRFATLGLLGSFGIVLYASLAILFRAVSLSDLKQNFRRI